MLTVSFAFLIEQNEQFHSPAPSSYYIQEKTYQDEAQRLAFSTYRGIWDLTSWKLSAADLMPSAALENPGHWSWTLLLEKGWKYSSLENNAMKPLRWSSLAS